jgi:hypothetical protein
VRLVKEECLSKLILFGENSLHRALAEFTAHFHSGRNHQARAMSYCSLFQQRGESVAVSTAANASAACFDITPVRLDFLSIWASFLFRATRSLGRSCLFPAFSGAAICADPALSTRHCRDPLAGSPFRTLRFHGCSTTQPAIGASILSYVQSKENGKVFTAEDLAGSRHLLGLGKGRSSPRDELLFVNVVQPEDEVGMLVQPRADAVEHGCDVLAHIGPIGTIA